MNLNTERNISYEDEDGRMLVIVVTSEGVIMDAFEDFGGTLVGTVGRMADEWWHHIAREGED